MEEKQAEILTTCNSRRRRSNDSSSPEFEFWMVRNPSFPTPNLLSADELFSGGVILPLHRDTSGAGRPGPGFDPIQEPEISVSPVSVASSSVSPVSVANSPVSVASSSVSPVSVASSSASVANSSVSAAENYGSGRPRPEFEQIQEPEISASVASSSVSSVSEVSASVASSSVSASKRWRDIIFKKGEKKSSNGSGNDEIKEKKKKSSNGGGNDEIKEKKEKKNSNGGAIGANGVSAAELNINIWPFRRSRSAGNGGGARPRIGSTHRKVSSAPCSRSNSAGESKSRKWPASPARPGLHLGRSSPVWQARRRSIDNPAKSSEKAQVNGLKKEVNGRRKTPSAAVHGGAPRARVLNLNVPMCIGYRHHLSCRSDENGTISATASGGGQSGDVDSGEGVRGSNLFNLRNLFTKKVY